MTIHSDWARILHEECPEAFRTATPAAAAARLRVGVIDGHLQLMCLSSHFQSWEGFLCGVFLHPIERLFDAGCTTVVMCFDSYDHVPVYKTMTQTKRAVRVSTNDAAQAFTAADELPAEIPREDTMAYLMNRQFKLKVIDLACARLPHMVLRRGMLSAPDRRFILDYKSAVEFTSLCPHIPMPLPELASLGESDIKFVRYVERFGSALVHAVDGDYIPISLLHYAQHGLRPDNRIYLLRHPSVMAPNAAERAAAAAAASDTTSDDDDNDKKSRKKRKKTTTTRRPQKCWVDMQLLYLTLSESMRQSLRGIVPLDPRTMVPFTEGDLIHAAVVFMLCAGTDFSRSLPLLGPKRMWVLLPDIAASLVQAAPMASFNVELMCDAVVGALYGAVFANHLKTADDDGELASVMANLRRAPKLALSTRNRLPTPDQVAVTLKNLQWVMRYWSTSNARVHTPLTGVYGYVRCPKTARITFADLLLA